MKIIKLIITILYLSISLTVNAQGYLEFVENKGQWDKNISFKGQLNTGAIALKPDAGYRMLQHNVDDLNAIHNYFHASTKKEIEQNKSVQSLGLHSNVYEVSFLGSNTNPQIISEKPQDTYNNYFLGNDPSKWASGCKIFQAVTYKNVYPNIDVRYYTGNGQLKYDLIVHPGGNPNQIILNFDGVEKLNLKQGNLLIKTSVNEEKELAPYSFQPAYSGRKEIGCNYKLRGNIITFNIDQYDNTIPLIIDPIKVFATFTGSTADNWGFTATYDRQGNFYAGGIVFGSGFPVSNGSTFQGGVNSEDGNVYDMGIIKFNSLGTARIFATYIGGSLGNDQPHSLIVDANGSLIIAGRTNSDNYPTTQPNFGPCGKRDIVLTKLNSLGNIIASIKIGGTEDDGMNIKPKYSNSPQGTLSLNRNYGDDARSEVIVDDAGNILLASCTQSLDFRTTLNAIQPVNGGILTSLIRKQDAVFIRASNDLTTILNSTYLGGDDDDAAFVLSIHPTNKNIYIAGGTASANFPGNKIGSYQSTIQGGDCDGFVAILNPDATIHLKTSFFGTSGSENIYGIQFDRFGFPYIMGTTTGQWPVLNVVYSQAFGKQFISKLKADLSGFVYSTTFGTNSPAPNISPTAFLVDRCENVYVSGWGGEINVGWNYQNSGTNGLPITANALQKTTDNSDFYFFVLERDAKSQLYGDFFGQNGGATGEHVDGGTSRFDQDGIIYQSTCANCGGGAVFPTTPGAYATNNGSTNCNLAALKIAFNLSGIANGVRSSIKGVDGAISGCVPIKVSFIDTIAEGTKYIWDFGDGSPTITTTRPDTSHFYNSIGSFTVKLISVDSSTCNIVDSSYLTIRIRSDSSTLKLTYNKVGNCTSNTYEFDNRTSIAPPGKPFKPNSFKINFGDNTPILTMGYQTIQHAYPSTGIYNGWMALVDTNYCNYPDTIFFRLNIVAIIKAKFTPPPTGCLSNAIQFTNLSDGGNNLVWYFGDGDSSTIENPSHTYTATGTYSVKLKIFDSTSCNKVDSVSYNFDISTSPKSIFKFTPNPPDINTPVNFINQSNGATNYIWYYGDGDTLATNNINQNVNHLYTATKTFNACLKVKNQFNCIDSSCQPVAARVSTLFDVPSAFSPNGNGLNDKIFVRGYGIKSIKWQIYNRWGVLVFTSNNISDGWDGTYQGKVQPQDVYHYTLLVLYFDDTKATKTGDITLLR